MTRLLLAVLAVILGGCVHSRPAAMAGCALVAYPLRVDAIGPRASTEDFEAVLQAAMAPSAGGRRFAEPRPSVLILSGGSQHGAFGAGFFAGMPQVPDYKLITAVSTGSLQSTLVFLANRPVPPDRRYVEYMAAQPGAVRSNVGDLALAYSIGKEGDLLKVGPFGLVGGVVRGSTATFTPLRAVLRGLLSPETLAAVGAAYRADPREGRRLLVGVTDVNDGGGYAIDLTELASRIVAGTQPYATVRECYIDALIASSSVPLAVPPVTLDVRDPNDPSRTMRHMYIDGGARFGVFWSQLGAVLAGGADPEVTLIVNGKLLGAAWRESSGKPRRTWSSLSLGLRAVDILENQVYRFSVENVERMAAEHGGVNLAFISSTGLPAPWGDPDRFEFDGRTCADWNEVDDQAKPTEFHPRYMRCLVEYGRARGRALAWNAPGKSR